MSTIYIPFYYITKDHYVISDTFVLFMYRHTKCERVRDKDFNTAKNNIGRWNDTTMVSCLDWHQMCPNPQGIFVCGLCGSSERSETESQNWQGTLLCPVNSTLICYVYISKKPISNVFNFWFFKKNNYKTNSLCYLYSMYSIVEAVNRRTDNTMSKRTDNTMPRRTNID